jgi:uncharacterized alpha-E superfamily protein
VLGRTANGIFWMFRYLERAENSARLLDAGFRLALMRGSRSDHEEWRSVLTTLGLEAEFAASDVEINRLSVTNYILRERGNPGSVLNMIENARNNARGVRTAITREVWEATNEGWMNLRQLLARPVRAPDFFSVLAAIRRHATLVRGAMEETMLRNEIFNFARLGTFLERADNTARILDVKYYVLLPSISWVGSNLDNAQWETVLRSVSGERAYRWLNDGGIDPQGIARFLILDRRFPRSLAFCYAKMRSNLSSLAKEYGEQTKVQELLYNADDKLGVTTIEAIIDNGLHEFLTRFLADNRKLADALATNYRFAV